MNFKRVNILLSLFWLVTSLIVVVLDVVGIINLAQNNFLFFGIIILMFVSFQVVHYYEKKSRQK